MKKILLIMLSLAISFTTVFSISGCNKDNSGNEDNNEIVVGGNSVNEQSVVSEIIGATDIYLTTNETEIDENKYNVFVKSGLEKLPAKLDVSSVKFGEKGEYDITWFYGENLSSATVKMQKKCLVFAEPVLVQKTDVPSTYKYSDLFKGIYDGISMKDSFGNEMVKAITDDGGLFNIDGTANSGTFTVKFFACDRAGQTLTCERTITVESEIENVEIGNYNYDVYDEFLYINYENTSLVAGISVGGIIVPEKYIKFSDKTIRIDSAFLREKSPAGKEYLLNIIQQRGVCSNHLKVTDIKNVGLVEGEIYNDETGFNPSIRYGFDLKRVEVNVSGSAGEPYCAIYIKNNFQYGDFDAFNNVFKNLNTNYDYTITAYAEKDGITSCQKTDCKIVKNGFSVSDGNTLGIVPSDTKNISVTKEREKFEGKTCYKWASSSSNCRGEKTALNFNFSADSGNYFIFDIYLTKKPLLLGLVFDKGDKANGKYSYLWDRYLLNDPATDEKNHPGWGGFEQYCNGTVKFYDNDGNKLKGDVLRFNHSHTWVTVEVFLPDGIKINEKTPDFMFLHNIVNLNEEPVYLANMRVSKNGAFADKTINSSFTVENFIEDVF